jgi:hypothetical protein
MDPLPGRPLLIWAGKHRGQIATADAAVVETYCFPGNAVQGRGEDWNHWPSAFARGGLLFSGDNARVLAYLIRHGFRGLVKLVFMFSQFDSC